MKRLSILIISQVFPPEIGAYRMIYNCALELRKMGHDITVVCGLPHYPTGVIPDEYKGGWVFKEDMEGMDVRRVFLIPSSNREPKKRLLTFCTFMISSLVHSLFMKKSFDAILAVSPPLPVGLTALATARLKRAPFILYLLDLEPESAVALGHIDTKGLTFRAARAISQALYDRARLILPFSEGARSVLINGKGVEPERVNVLTGGVDTELFKPMKRDAGLAASLGLDGRFVVMYIGTFGRIHNLPTLIEAAEILKGDPGIRFVLVGDGEERAPLEKLVSEKGLSETVSILPPAPTEEVPRYISISDVCVSTTKRAPLHEGIIPAKILEYSACGKAALIAIEGETKRLLEQSGAGLCVAPEDPAAFAEALVALRSDPDLLNRMGSCGVEMVREKFSQAVMGRNLENMLRAIVE